MKNLLSLILPGNPTDNVNRRYLKNGRKGLGFAFGQLAIIADNGAEYGVGSLIPSDVDSDVANGATITTRLSVASGTTPTITMPAVDGEIREVWLVNGASGNCTLDTSGSVKIFTGTADADTLVIATGKTAHLLSNGTKWFHVSNDA